jgi:hypothetical protein
MNIISTRSIANALLLICASFSYHQAATLQQRSSISINGNEWVWVRVENGREVEIKIVGRVGFTDGYDGVKFISPGGSLSVRDVRGAAPKSLRMEPDDQGGPKITYSVEGKEQNFDADAKRWVAELVAGLVKQGGIDASARTKSLLNRSGVGAVLEEISSVISDEIKVKYYIALLEDQALAAAAAPRIIRHIAGKVSSDLEKRQALSKVAERYPNDDNTSLELLSAAATLSLDSERERILTLVINRANFNDAHLKGASSVIHDMSSDLEKAKILISMIRAYKGDYAEIPEFFNAINTIGSDGPRNRVLLTLLSHSKLGKKAIMRVIESAAAISSDRPKADVLIRVASVSKGDESVRKSLIDAARSINSSSEHRRVTSAILK